MTASVEGAAFFLQDDFGGFGPHERFGIGVVVQEVVVDRGLQFGNAGEGSAPDTLPRDLREEALHEVHPRGARRREVQLEAGMLGKSAVHLVGLMGRGIIEHDVDVEVLLHDAEDDAPDRRCLRRV